MSLQELLHELLCGLYYIGRDMPQCLVYLSEVAQPNLPADRRIPIISKMFEEMPKSLQQLSSSELQDLVANPPNDAVSLRLLLDIREVSLLLQRISCLQLLHLTNNVLPPGPLQMQVDFLARLKEVFQGWDHEKLEFYHKELADTPLYLESQKLFTLEPDVPWEHLHLLIELLKLPVEELFSFHDWITTLDQTQLQILTKLLQLEPAFIFEIQKRLAPNVTLDLPISSLNVTPADVLPPPTPASPSPAPTIEPPPVVQSLPPIIQHHPPPVAPSSSSGGAIKLEAGPTPAFAVSSSSSSAGMTITIARQPPPKTVYQRILKPHPAISLAGSGAEGAPNLFVEATLIKCDQDVEVPSCLDGNKVVRISNGTFATFKKLKILSTSQQQGTLFRLKFVLQRYTGNSFSAVPGAVVYSNPIEVFSHTVYLNEKTEGGAPPPTVSDVIPASGPTVGNTRVAILGNNFLNNPNLMVRFGSVEVKPVFHESGTLICQTPPHATAGVVPVTATNDRYTYGDTRGYFQYY